MLVLPRIPWLVFAAFGGGLAPHAETIAFAPAEGVVLRKTFTRELCLPIERVSFAGGGLFAPAQHGSWIDHQRVVVTDAYGPLADGLPLRLTRTYEAVRREHEHDLTLDVPSFFRVRVHVPQSGRGVLEGRTVVFTREDGEGAADCASGDGKYVAAEDLSGLEEDADLRGLLPWEDRVVGDAWFTDVEAFRQLCWPGGAMTLVDDHGYVFSKPVDQVAARDLEGTFRVELLELREVAGRPVAHLGLRCVLTAKTSFDHDLEIATDIDLRGYLPQSLTLDVRQELDLYLVATGTVDWDLAGGHLAALELTGKVEVGQVARATARETIVFDEAFDFEAEWSGTFAATVEVERLPAVAREPAR